MNIHQNFTGGNITVTKIDNDTVFLERQIRDTDGDWFYWAFCAEGFAGHTVTFVFPSEYRVGRYGAAVSHDLKAWHWSESGSGDRFTYTFASDETCVYFAHDMLYHPDRFYAFCADRGLEPEPFCKSEKGRDLPCVRFGSGDQWILLTARHHACESTGGYVLEGVIDTMLSELPAEYSVLAVPFVDLDGVLDGDQGKNRRSHDHNQDYDDTPVYEVTAALKAFSREHALSCTFDFHSPWHIGPQNDHIFFSHSTEAMKPHADRFGERLAADTAHLPLRYTGNWDVGPNEQWNNENSINSKNYYSRLPGVRLTVTIETPYFGVDDGKISQDAMLIFGRTCGNSIAAHIRDGL
ncbi:MAG: hypothetical protein E7604_00090 [Ruminococcaceae bacterium]|nr:hypothetical protein [Oscillospiraceae bacterium]